MTLILTAIHVIACVSLIVLVLLQSGKGTGLASVFGGGGGGQTLFGPRTSTFLTRLTTGLAITFMVTSLTLALASAWRRPAAAPAKVTEEGALAPESSEGGGVVPEETTGQVEEDWDDDLP